MINVHLVIMQTGLLNYAKKFVQLTPFRIFIIKMNASKIVHQILF